MAPNTITSLIWTLAAAETRRSLAGRGSSFAAELDTRIAAIRDAICEE